MRRNLSVHRFSRFGHSHSAVQFVSDMQSEVPQAFPAGVLKRCGRLPRVVDPHRQTPLYCRQEDTGILIAHDEHYWKEIVFDKSSTSITQTNVDSLFLLLAASGILEIQNSPEGIRWMLGCQAPTIADTNVALIHATIGTAKYTLDKYWVGINLHPVTRIRVRTPAIPTP